jgi:hypothetical protein
MLKKVNTTIAAFAALFVIVLAIAAWLDRSIIILHMVEALPYIIGPLLCLRQNKFGYALCFASGAFWLWTGGFLTTFVHNGFEQLIDLIRTGTLKRFDILIAVPAAIGTAGLVIFSSLGYIMLPNKSLMDILLFVLTVILITIFFLIIFRLFAPKYLEMFRGIFFIKNLASSILIERRQLITCNMRVPPCKLPLFPSFKARPKIVKKMLGATIKNLDILVLN